MIDFETKKKYYNLCDPYEPLEPEDKRNVDLDVVGEDHGCPVRGASLIDNFVEDIGFSDKPILKLFTGLPGSGKTTELKKLAKRLSGKEEGNLFTILIDARDVIDLANPVDVVDIISAIIYSTEKAIIKKKGGNAEKALDEGYCQRLWHWLNSTDAELTKAEFAIPSSGKLVYEMKIRPSLRQRVRAIVNSRLSKFIQDASNELEKLKDVVRLEFNRDGIVIIFDTLERLRGTTSNWYEVLESAEHLFSVDAPHLKLPVHAIYTVPAALDRRIMDIDFLPMIKVRCKDNNKPYKPGIKAARELIRKRVPDEILKEIFGPDINRLNGLIDRLILWSGGYPREIFQMLQKAVGHTKHPISNTVFEYIIAEIGNRHRKVIPGEAFKLLANVARSKYLEESESDRKIADYMLRNHAVLRYRNNDIWFDLHPAVYKIPGVQEAINNLEKKKKTL